MALRQKQCSQEKRMLGTGVRSQAGAGGSSHGRRGEPLGFVYLTGNGPCLIQQFHFWKRWHFTTEWERLEISSGEGNGTPLQYF